VAAQVLVVDDTPENLELMTYLLKAFGHHALVARDGAAGVALAREAKPDLVVMDLQMPVMSGFEAAASLRSDPQTADIPLVAVTAYAMVGDRDKILEAGFDGYIAKPIDPEAFVQQVESFLPDPRTTSSGEAVDDALPGDAAGSVPQATAPDGGAPEALLSEDLAGRARRTLAERLAVLQAAAAAVEEGRLTTEERRHAARQAHRIAGAAASYGYPAATEPARAVEAILDGDEDIRPMRLAMSVRTLRSAMSSQMPAPTSALRPQNEFVIAVVGDRTVAESLDKVDTPHNVSVRHIPPADDVPRHPAMQWAHVVVLDLAATGSADASLTLLDRIAERTPAPAILVLADDAADRVELAARGAHGYHDRSLDPDDLLDECLRIASRDTIGPTVLVIDDDELVLANVAATLEPAGLRVVQSEAPKDLPALLEEVRPDLLVLNLDLAGIDGAELCRMLRMSAQWAALPVLFLTAARDAAVVERIFRSGADDYVAKPVIGAELLVRVRNRLDRVEIYRRLADIDSLTGLPSRRHCEERVHALLALAKRFDRPLSLALIDLDHFKLLNDRYGHAAGDDALRAVGMVLSDGLRGEDVVGRWGGEEFLVAMYGMTSEDAVRRLESVHDAYRSQVRLVAPGATSSFSAGIATYPADAGTLDRLLTVADRRLYRAKSQGRARIVTTGWTHQVPGPDSSPEAT
jgi:diguanylate cyclase (GGDEF)-like protein